MPAPTFTIYKPQYPAGINWGLSLAEGLVFCALFDDLYPVDLVTDILGTASGGPSIYDKEDGLSAAIVAASAQYFTWPDRPDLNPLAGRTVHWRGWVASGGAYRQFIQKGTGSDGTATPYSLLSNNDADSTVMFMAANAGGFRDFTSGLTLAADANRMRSVSAVAKPLIDTPVQFIIDGAVVVGTAGPFNGTGTGAPTTSADSLRIGRRADGGTQLDGGVSLVNIWGLETEIGALQELHDRPFLLFRRSPWMAGGITVSPPPDITVALTGVAATGSVDSVTTSIDVDYGGSLGDGPHPAADRNGRTRFFVQPGAYVDPVVDVTVEATGVAGTGAAGSLVPSVAAALTGVAVTGAVGSLVPSVTLAATGVAATAAAGTVAPSTTVGITGVAATGAVGSVTVGADATAALTGVAATASVGSVVPSASLALTGVAATGAEGSVVPSVSKALTGVAGTGAVGTVTATVGGNVTAALTGVAATASAGTLSPSGGDTGITADTHDGGHYYRQRARKLAEIADARRRTKDDEASEIRRELLALVSDAMPLQGVRDVREAYAAVKAAVPARTPEKVSVAQIERITDLRPLMRAVARLEAAIEYERMIDADDEEVLLLL